jgi:P27 family predicted phage terminase small subunit
MPAGRPGRPTALKLLAGVQKSKINQDEPQPEPGIPQCPSDDPLVVEVWEYTVGQLREMKVVTMADRDALFAYCQQVALNRRATEILAREGLFINVLNSPSCPHPALKMQADSAAKMKSFAIEFGLTPAARTRIRVKESQTQGPAKLQDASRLLS